jgi:dihydroorotate dehydrogenase
MYQIAKQFLFKMDAEKAHHFTIQFLQLFKQSPELLQLLLGKPIQNEQLHREVLGLHFANPIGLAAGLDKNGEVIDQMAALGFGFVEIGTITPKPQPGNEKPRLFRLVNDAALINRMGFNNVGADLAAARLSRRKTNIVVGANIGKNKTTENENAYRDYEICFNTLFDAADYFVVNVSSPNTPGLRALQDKESLTQILSSLQNINAGKSKPKPLLLKIAPDLTEEQIHDVASVAKATQLNGIVATNTTVSRKNISLSQEAIDKIGAGGLSGKPITQLATSVIKTLANALKNEHYNVPIIGVGGIMNANDAKEKLDAGAALVQLYSGFIYGGPQLIKDINNLLLQAK